MCEKFKIFGIVTRLSKWQKGQNTPHLEVLWWFKSLFLHNCLVPRFATCVNLFICIMMKCNHWSIYTQIVITLFIWKSSMIFCAICDKKVIKSIKLLRLHWCCFALIFTHGVQFRLSITTSLTNYFSLWEVCIVLEMLLKSNWMISQW